MHGLDDFCFYNYADWFFCTLNTNGNFKISNNQIVHTHNPINKWYKLFWARHIPLKVSIFKWKIFHNAIPVDHLSN